MASGSPKVKLHETHAVGIRLPGRREKSDRAGLCGHYRKTYLVPAQGLMAKQVSLQVTMAAVLVDS
jgi:hypothetical protein